MAADVAQKIIQANTIKQGIAVMGVTRLGTKTTEQTYVDSKPTIEDIAVDNQDRFDDPTYYDA